MKKTNSAIAIFAYLAILQLSLAQASSARVSDMPDPLLIIRKTREIRPAATAHHSHFTAFEIASPIVRSMAPHTNAELKLAA